VRGRKVADGVVAMVVPGSSTVKREAEAGSLDRVFRDAGLEPHIEELVALWDGKSSGDAAGGTAHMVDLARASGRMRVVQIDPGTLAA